MLLKPTQLPERLYLRLQKQLGDQFYAFNQAMTTPAPSSIRLNPGKPTELFQRAEAIPWCAQGRYLETRPSFTLDPLFHAGAYYVQEASSMFLAHLLTKLIDLKRDLRVLDLSAAPGGKATLLQSLLSRDSLLVANEIISGRNKILGQNLMRWGGDNHIVTQSDPKIFQRLPGYFDVVLVDAPCSGEGLMRKEPTAIHEWSEQNVQLCASRQKRILGDVVPALAPGGFLIYSTCTFSETENEENMRWLQKSTDLDPVGIDIPADWGIQVLNTDLPGYRFYPHQVKGEGFFIAAFRKRAGESARQRASKSGTSKQRLESANSEDRHWLSSPDRYHFLTRDQHRIALPKTFRDDYQILSRNLRITHSGLNMGKIYHGQLKPAPELALSQALSSNLPSVELDRESALDFLAHSNFHLPENLKHGRYLVTHNGYGLGWINVLKTGQVRNNYPSAWRILQRHGK